LNTWQHQAQPDVFPRGDGFLQTQNTFKAAFPKSPGSFSAVDPLVAAFTAIEHEIREVCDLYFGTMNTWLPVVIETNLRKELENIGKTKDLEAETCLLMLCIYLLTHEPTPATEDVSATNKLYTILKSSYYAVQSFGNPTLVTIQAGMLLAIYEQGLALQKQSYLTIGACARMGHAIGLHKTISLDSSPKEPDPDLEDQRHVWYCVIAFER
jgi:hypothetical protein